MSRPSPIANDKPEGEKRTLWIWLIVPLAILLLIGAIILVLGFFCLGTTILDGDLEVANKSDIDQMGKAVAAFHQDFNLGKEYFPSRFVLCERYADYVTGLAGPHRQLYADSLSFLQRMFPLLWNSANAQQTIMPDWNSNGKVDGPVVLEGDQCLVFFLGGIQGAAADGPVWKGFSTDRANPAAVTNNRKGPYFEFESNRLIQVHPDNTYFSCLDRFKKKPYAYFSSYNTRNGYNRYFSLLKDSDCATLGVWPYAKSISPNGIVVYQRPAKFQIISAGEDQTFGPGTNLSLLLKKPPQQPITWTPGTAADLTGPGRDDQSNFHDKPLGIR